jgi:leucyl aminopeptidase
MNFKAVTGNYYEAEVQAVVAPIFKDEKADSGILQELDGFSGGNISAALQSEEFKGKEGETLYLPLTGGNIKAKRVLLVGMGEQGDYKAPGTGVLAGTAARFMRGKSVKSFVLITRSSDNAVDTAAAAAQGVITGLFELDKYRTADKEERTIEEVAVAADGAAQGDLESGLERGKVIGESMNFTRDLANEPANILTPTEMANRAKAMAAEVGLKCEILDEAQMEKLGMGSLLSVSAGSEQPAKLIVLKYEPKTSTAKEGALLALVGKGITFDTGGISLKPAEGMDAMKYDMSGGATVIGTMRAVGLLKPSVPLLGVIAAVENMPDGKATRPGDVVTAMTGKTVEILNTDAEGRLVLADAVAYAEKEGATRIVDMATLTGAVVIALGDIYTGILGASQGLVDEVIGCSKDVGEKFWQLPLGKEYSAQIKSDIADIKNIGKGRKAGTIAGAVFIQEFVKDAEWAHLDIAGTAWNDEPKPHHSKGPSGVAIRTLIRLVEKSQ